MRKDKDIAVGLRQKGMSYMQINRQLGVPRATLSDWFSGVDWSQDLKHKLAESAKQRSTIRLLELNKVRGKELEQAYKDARTEALNELEYLKKSPVFIAGLMLYWGEGDKVSRCPTRLINTDPEMIRLFVHFLKDICGIPVEKIRASVLIYPDLNAEESIVYWSDVAGIPVENFMRCTVIASRHKTKRVSHGMCTIYVFNSYFKAKMLAWLSALPEQLIGLE